MNINVDRLLYGSGLQVGYPYSPTQLPNQQLRYGVTLINASGSTGPAYLGPSGMNWTTGFQLAVGAGITVQVDNTNLLWVVPQSGNNIDIRWIGN